MKKSNSASRGILLVLVATLLLAIRSVLVKLAFLENVPVMTLFYYRFVFTVPLLIGFAYIQKRGEFLQRILEKRVFFGCVAAGFFGYYLATLMDFTSLSLIDASVNRLILYSFPIYVLVFSAVLERRWPAGRDVVIFGLVQVGLFFVVGGVEWTLGRDDWLGALLAWGAAVSYSVYILINQQLGKQIGSVLFTTYAVCFSFLFISGHFWLTPGANSVALTALSAKAIVIIMVMAVFCTFLPLLLISEGIKRIGATRFSLINSSGPMMTIGIAASVLGETLSVIQMIGGAAVVGLLYLSERFN